MTSTVLIVDDHDQIRTMLRRLVDLEGLGNVVEANYADEGLTVFKEENPDVVLVDYMMPEMTGVEFARVLRHEHGYQGPILLYSSAGGMIPRAEVEALGIDVIEKTSITELLEALRVVMAPS
jgi:two-component system, OmpR family, phosphate regulon response regulator PhoB